MSFKINETRISGSSLELQKKIAREMGNIWFFKEYKCITLNISERTHTYEEIFEKKLQHAEKPQGWLEHIKELIMLASLVAFFLVMLPLIIKCLMNQNKRMKTFMKTHESNQEESLEL